MTLPDKLIIFDYSGTLSPAASAFSRPGSLLRYLQESGLAGVGVDNPVLFWEIVNSTWIKGSTTGSGYKTVMQERIAELISPKSVIDQVELSRAVENFVNAYLAHSRIDEAWRGILQELSDAHDVRVIIATDHYAEATDVIIAFLEEWGISAARIGDVNNSKFIVANSADIGSHKADRGFWETIREKCNIHANRILLIDDFGRNEQNDDAYVGEEKVFRRSQSTVKLLENLFSVPVESLFFTATNMPLADFILQVSEKIREFLS